MSEFIWLNPFIQNSEPEPILRDVFDGWKMGQGIFPYLSSVAEMPWSDDENVHDEVLDLSYFGNHSGSKFCSPLVKILLEDGVVPAASRTVIAKVLVSKYLPNWKALWATNVASYDPIHNYNMYEERDLTTTEDETVETDEEIDHTGTDTMAYGKVDTIAYGEVNTREHDTEETTTYGKVDTLAHGEVNTRDIDTEDTTEYGMVDTIDHGKEIDETTYKYGLNSVTLRANPSDEVVSAESGDTVDTKSGSDTLTKDGTIIDTKSGSDVDTLSGSDVLAKEGTVTDTKSGSDVDTLSGSDIQTKNLTDARDSTVTTDNDGTEHEEIHRYGNIGVTTTQKLLQEERNLWIWNYFDQIFADLDRELALAFHDPCRV